MFKNYLIVAVRNLVKHKGYSIINITGLAVGLAIFSLTAALFKFQTSFNQFHRDADRIYSIVKVISSGSTDDRHTTKTRAPLRNLLLNEFSEIEDATRWIPTDRVVVSHGRKKFYVEEAALWFVDPNFLAFFSFEMLIGDAKTALSEPNAAVLTESLARKYFGKIDVVGQRLTTGKGLELVVQGVTRDVPLNSSLKYEVLASLKGLDLENNWNVHGATFIRLADSATTDGLEHKFPAFIKRKLSDSPDKPNKLYLLALKDINLKSYGIRTYWPKDIPEIVYLTFGVGIIMLLAVCFNFINLATAGYLIRAKEVAVRKAIGASRRQLRWQFLGESVLMSLIAFPVSIVFKEIIQPLFVYLVASGLSDTGPNIWNNPSVMAVLLAVTLLVGLVAGSYPSLLLSRLEPVKILRENLPTGKKSIRIRETLIVLQLIAATFSVLITLVSFNQYDYLRKFDIGYEKNRILTVPLGTSYTRDKLRHLTEDLTRHPDIEAVSTAMWVPASWGTQRRVIPEGGEDQEAWTMNAYGIDYGLIELLGIEILRGRSFARKFADSGNYLINQMAAEQFQWDNPIGKKLKIRGKSGLVIGVVKDFHFKNLLERIDPTVLFLEPNYLNYLYIKLADAPVSRVINFLENRWRIFSADMPFEFVRLSEHYEKNLSGIKRWGALAGLISVFIILFSCLGLFGLASYTTLRRTKEIGIRKAHGASRVNIIRLILMDFFRLILIAMIVTWPLFYYIDRMLVPDIFAYSAGIGFAFYLVAGLLALVTGLSAVLFQTIKAARANPIDALRYE
jgi:putative ABC transport system permease protein